jgi:hypothetical protein
MSKTLENTALPKYRCHKQFGLAIVTFRDGPGGARRDFTLANESFRLCVLQSHLIAI